MIPGKQITAEDHVIIPSAPKPIEFVHVADNLPLTNEKIKKIPVAEFERTISDERKTDFQFNNSFIIPNKIASYLKIDPLSSEDADLTTIDNTTIAETADIAVIVNHGLLGRITCAARDIAVNTFVGLYASIAMLRLLKIVTTLTNEDSYDFKLSDLPGSDEMLCARALGWGNHTCFAPHLPSEHELKQYMGAAEILKQILTENLVFRIVNYNGYKTPALYTKSPVKKFQIMGPSYQFDYFKKHRIHHMIGPALLDPSGNLLDWVVDISLHYIELDEVIRKPILLKYLQQKNVNQKQYDILKINAIDIMTCQFDANLYGKIYSFINAILVKELKATIRECQQIIETGKSPDGSDHYVISVHVFKIKDDQVITLSTNICNSWWQLNHYLLAKLEYYLNNPTVDSPFLLKNHLNKPALFLKPLECSEWYFDPVLLFMQKQLELDITFFRQHELRAIGIAIDKADESEQWVYKIKRPALFLKWHLAQIPKYTDSYLSVADWQEQKDYRDFFSEIISLYFDTTQLPLHYYYVSDERQKKFITISAPSTACNLESLRAHIEKFMGRAINICGSQTKMVEFPLTLHKKAEQTITVKKQMHMIFIDAVNFASLKETLIQHLEHLLKEFPKERVDYNATIAASAKYYIEKKRKTAAVNTVAATPPSRPRANSTSVNRYSFFEDTVTSTTSTNDPTVLAAIPPTHVINNSRLRRKTM